MPLTAVPATPAGHPAFLAGFELLLPAWHVFTAESGIPGQSFWHNLPAKAVHTPERVHVYTLTCPRCLLLAASPVHSSGARLCLHGQELRRSG